MSLVQADTEYEVLGECRYSYPTEVVADVRSVTSTYRDLRLFVDFYCHTNKDRKKLVNLSGTIPVLYSCTLYNIPVCIWLHETHPQTPPKCFVRPSSAMVINANSTCVDSSGLVFLPCLSNWKHGWSNLSAVVEEMIVAFQRETPLFTALPLVPQTPPPPREMLAEPGPCTEATLLDPLRQYIPEGRLTARNSQPARVSPQNIKTPPICTSPSQTQGTRSYTQELLELGISFGETKSHVPSPCNPFIQRNPQMTDDSSSNSEDLDDLFKSLQLENRGDLYQLKRSSPGVLGPIGDMRCEVAPASVEQGPVDDRHTVEVSQLPLGFPPNRMKNKLTIYFQRQQNGGGEVLDVTYPATRADSAFITFCEHKAAEQVLKHAEQVFTVNQQHFPIHVKKVDRVPIPADIPAEKADVYRSLMSLPEQRFAPDDVQEAVQSCRDLASALRYLTHECPICQELVSFSKIITMTHCSCAFCENCFKAYFSSVIKEKSIISVVCPICNKPDMRGAGHKEEVTEYFNLLDTQIRHYLDRETHELFQRKLRDRTLQEMPNFRWCAHCSFGLLHEADRLRMDCPSCGKSTCSKCKSPWMEQHEGLSCEKFRDWQLYNNPEYQTHRLEQLLCRNKIDCPKCKFRFYLSKGGCLHFKCTQCQHEFCGGCGRPFRVGPECNFSEECKSKGLHAHHPRDCLYHLRDWSVSRLQQLLQRHQVSYTLQLNRDWKESKGACPVLELREPGSLKEESCGSPAPPEFGGYCIKHYKEFLVEVINMHRLDPAQVFEEVEVLAELKRWRIPIPQTHRLQPKGVYLQQLRQIVMREVRLMESPMQETETKPVTPPIAGNPWAAAQDSLSQNSRLPLLLSD